MSFVRYQSPYFIADFKSAPWCPYKFVNIRSWSFSPPWCCTGGAFSWTVANDRAATCWPWVARTADRDERLASEDDVDGAAARGIIMAGFVQPKAFRTQNGCWDVGCLEEDEVKFAAIPAPAEYALSESSDWREVTWD